ncbi:MAG: ribonuclease HII [Sarcina sp.]
MDILELIKESTEKKLSFKVLNEKTKEIEVKTENLDLLYAVIEVLKKDDRKNVLALANKIEKQINAFISEVDRVKSMYEFDRNLGEGKIVAGVDEVGRGPLAGPIVAASVVLDLNNMEDIILEINDSKMLSEVKRERLAQEIKKRAIAYSISEKSNDEIDEKGISYCNNQIFIDACNNLGVEVGIVLSDGYLIKNYDGENKFVIKGDRKSASIACASIIAKVYRDNLMKEYAKKYPHYDFEHNVGYGTKKHLEGLKEYGPTDIHRKYFIKNLID